MTITNPNPAYGASLEAFAGIPTFMRQPASRKLEDVDVAIVGVPFEGGANSFRSGTRFGPRKIREMSLIMWGYNNALNVAPLDVLNLVDYGDITVEPTNIQENIKSITTQVSAILELGPTVIALGGDHSISYPLLRTHAVKFGPLAVVHFDSHSDTSKRPADHGTPFRQAIEERLIDTKAYIQVGIRGPNDYATATGTPKVGGFTSYQILQLVRGLQGLNLVGFDLVEVSPPYDNPGKITSIPPDNLTTNKYRVLYRPIVSYQTIPYVFYRNFLIWWKWSEIKDFLKKKLFGKLVFGSNTKSTFLKGKMS